MKLIRTRDYLLIALIGLVFLVLGGIFDRNVSQFLFVDASDTMNKVGVIISNCALIPFFFVSIVAAVIGLFTQFNRKNEKPTWFRVLFIVIFFGLGAFLLYQGFDKLRDIGGVHSNTLGIILAIAILLVLLGCGIFVGYLMSKRYDYKVLFKYVLIFAVIVLIANALSFVMKYLWSRPRPYYIFGTEDIPAHTSFYLNFWELQPFEAFKAPVGEYFKSFPSNHTTTSMLVLPALLLYTKLNDRFDKGIMRIIILYGVFVLALLTGFTRMVAGAHFLSDVSFGLISGFTITYFAFFTLSCKEKKEVTTEVDN